VQIKRAFQKAAALTTRTVLFKRLYARFDNFGVLGKS